VLFESRAIVRYLDARLAGTPLVPPALRARARMDQWLSVDQSFVAPNHKQLVGHRIVRKHQGMPTDTAAAAEVERALGEALGAIDRALAGDRYLAGEAFSLADISLMPYVASLPMIEAQHLLGDLRHVARWWGEVSARASWRATAA